MASFFVNTAKAYGQGRVVVNEFMAWSGCNTTSEFIELLNFGPGPMDISCYVVTNGQYAVTIPQGTVLKSGQYFVLAGQNQLLKGCGNLDSNVTVNLNWSTCNCTDKPVPVTGDGFFKDGGNANEKVVLLDPNKNIVDAVSRYATPSTSALITTKASTTCGSYSFDLDLMNLHYESIENSTGIDNSFARRVDGDCGWVKTPAISPGAANKTGSTASATYNFSNVSASDCSNVTGSVSIQVSATNVGSLFPMNYTLGYDTDNNGLFTAVDRYSFGVDSSSPSIDINNLSYGRYSMTVGSALGCNLQTFNFFIFNCYGLVLPVKLASFKYVKTESEYHEFEYEMTGVENLKAVYLEGEGTGGFSPINALSKPSVDGRKKSFQTPVSVYTAYRLRIVSNSGQVTYSPVVKVASSYTSTKRLWPNPATSFIQTKISSDKMQQLNYAIVNALGVIVAKGQVAVATGTNLIKVPIEKLTAGTYQVTFFNNEGNQSEQFAFLKQ